MRTAILISLITCILFVLSVLPIDVFGQTDHVSLDDDNAVTGLTSGRARSLIGVVLGLTSVILGWTARTRKRLWIITAFLSGIIAIILSVIHLVNIAGGFGTGSGKAGASVALVLGLLGCLLCIRAFRIQGTP